MSGELTIRPALSEDAAAILAYLRQIGAESDNLTFGPEGLPITEEQERQYLRQVENAPAALLLTEECTRTVYAVQLLPPIVWEDPLPPLPDAPAALSLTLTMRDVEEIDACPAALGHRLACDKAGKRWLHHPRAETYLSERVALFQRLYR